MFYNPLLDCFEVEVPIRLQWHLVLEDLCKKVERAIVKNKLSDVWLHLNVVDLVCQETGMYYREYGIDIIGKGTDNEIIQTSSANDVLGDGSTVPELAFQSREVLSLFD